VLKENESVWSIARGYLGMDLSLPRESIQIGNKTQALES
jgi:hypothetical protein